MRIESKLNALLEASLCIFHRWHSFRECWRQLVGIEKNKHLRLVSVDGAEWSKLLWFLQFFGSHRLELLATAEPGAVGDVSHHGGRQRRQYLRPSRSAGTMGARWCPSAGGGHQTAYEVMPPHQECSLPRLWRRNGWPLRSVVEGKCSTMIATAARSNEDDSYIRMTFYYKILRSSLLLHAQVTACDRHLKVALDSSTSSSKRNWVTK